MSLELTNILVTNSRISIGQPLRNISYEQKLSKDPPLPRNTFFIGLSIPLTLAKIYQMVIIDKNL
jgi:hypothetical protein